MEGKLSKIYRDLRYGFIKAGNSDYFFHKDDYDGDWRALCNDYDAGDRPILEFVPGHTDKGLRASEVQYVGS